MLRSQTVLIVDDYPDSLDVWSMYLRAAGYHVLTAADGPTALERATRFLPDLVVLDLELPGLDGWQVAQALRASTLTHDTPLIAATGCNNTQKVDYAWKVGFDQVLLKPCDPERLVSEVSRLLDARPQVRGRISPAPHGPHRPH